jgi:hypothetical protein
MPEGTLDARSGLEIGGTGGILRQQDSGGGGMNGKVYLLWFVQERDDSEDCELLIGVYSSEPKAKEAIERVKEKRSFADFPEGFQIHAYQLDQDHWTDGFIVD